MSPALTLLDHLDALVRELRDEAHAASGEARSAENGIAVQAVYRGEAAKLHDASRRLEERIVRAAPRCAGGDGYSESWLVTCPGGCGAILDWQRFLFRGGGGRFCDEDTVRHQCPRCGHDLEDYDPEALIVPVIRVNKAIREAAEPPTEEVTAA